MRHGVDDGFRLRSGSEGPVDRPAARNGNVGLGDLVAASSPAPSAARTVPKASKPTSSPGQWACLLVSILPRAHV